MKEHFEFNITMHFCIETSENLIILGYEKEQEKRDLITTSTDLSSHRSDKCQTSNFLFQVFSSKYM